MEGILLILGLGYLIWLIIRHPLKSLGWVFKLTFLFILGLVPFGALFYIMMNGGF